MEQPPATGRRSRRGGGGGTAERSQRRRLQLRLADGTPAEAFARVAKALDRGAITISEARQLGEVLQHRLRVQDAERWEARVRLAEAKALEAARLAGGRRLVLPAAEQTLDAEEVEP